MLKDLRIRFAVLALSMLCMAAGCAVVPTRNAFRMTDEPANEKKENDKEEEAKEDEPPKTLMTWNVGKRKNGDRENGEAEAPEVDTIETDRPDFTEASTTVGKGRIQLESGYTFIRDRTAGTRSIAHSYPELLFRIGMFAEWFELRIGQNWGHNTSTTGGATTITHGADDLYLGVKLALTEQARIFPESALVLQMTVPSGHPALSANQVLPGFNYLYGWDVIKDRLTLGGSAQVNRSIDDLGQHYAEYAQSATVGVGLTERIASYTEWFAIYHLGTISPNVGTEHYLNGGFTYLFRPNIQFDVRAGVGLNDKAQDLFTGAGFAVRY